MKIDAYVEFGCPVSRQLKDYLGRHKGKNEVSIWHMDEELAAATAARYPQFANPNALYGMTLPAVVVDGRPIGGYDALVNLLGGQHKKVAHAP